MAKKVNYIPTLQEYMKKRKRARIEFLDPKSCRDCDYFRTDLDVCVWGDNVRLLTAIKTCPVTHRDLL